MPYLSKLQQRSGRGWFGQHESLVQDGHEVEYVGAVPQHLEIGQAGRHQVFGFPRTADAVHALHCGAGGS